MNQLLHETHSASIATGCSYVIKLLSLCDGLLLSSRILGICRSLFHSGDTRVLSAAPQNKNGLKVMTKGDRFNHRYRGCCGASIGADIISTARIGWCPCLSNDIGSACQRLRVAI